MLAVVVACWWLRGAGVPFGRAHIARLTVSGIITEDRKLVDAVSELGRRRQRQGADRVDRQPRRQRRRGRGAARCDRPRGRRRSRWSRSWAALAASAGYMVAVPAARIFAREGTLTGSIGVLLETGEVSGLLKTLGVTAEAITSGPLKDQPSFIRPMTPEGRDVLHGPGDGHVRPVRRHGGGRPAHGRRARCANWPTAAPIPGGRRCTLAWSMRSAARLTRGTWLAQTKGVSADLPVR